MLTAPATVIDFEAYRTRRLKREREVAESKTANVAATVASIVWMPVWIVPVFYMMGAVSAGAARG